MSAAEVSNPARIVFAIVLILFSGALAGAQPVSVAPEVPENFTADKEMAAQLRPLLSSESTEAIGRYPTGILVLQNLVDQENSARLSNLQWELRIVDEDLLNAFSSPDGTIYVDRSLAQLANTNSGLWAAILSHEIIHVVRRDWARRFLYRKSLQASGGVIVLDNSMFGSGGWADTEHASEALAAACRQIEIEADAGGMMLMARAGYHPAFVAALHHLLRAQPKGSLPASDYAMHPRWEMRDRELERTYVAAGLEFDRFWPERYLSPGGEPPVVVFADEPTIKTVHASQREIRVSMRCEHLAGAVEVVLRTRPLRGQTPLVQQLPSSPEEVRQLTGCTSNKTQITFSLPGGQNDAWSDVYVLDDSGLVLARAELPRLRR